MPWWFPEDFSCWIKVQWFNYYFTFCLRKDVFFAYHSKETIESLGKICFAGVPDLYVSAHSKLVMAYILIQHSQEQLHIAGDSNDVRWHPVLTTNAVHQVIKGIFSLKQPILQPLWLICLAPANEQGCALFMHSLFWPTLFPQLSASTSVSSLLVSSWTAVSDTAG